MTMKYGKRRIVLDSRRSVEVEAWSFGRWFIHRPAVNTIEWLRGMNGYRVSYGPRGVCLGMIADDLERDDAIRIAGHLHERVPVMKLGPTIDGQVTFTDPETEHIIMATVAEALAVES